MPRFITEKETPKMRIHNGMNKTIDPEPEFTYKQTIQDDFMSNKRVS